MIYRIAFLTCTLFTSASGINLTTSQARELGNKIWYNECRNSVEKLTFWKKGEQWASLGIGHFIWYPKNKKGIYEEQFPELLNFLVQHKIRLPAWLRRGMPCPWDSQEAFNKDLNSARMLELRNWLASTIDLQAQFIAQRLEQALPNLMHACDSKMREHVHRQFNRLAQSPAGLYAIIDYLNFKGAGTNPLERYSGQGWGLLQILERMKNAKEPVNEFAQAAQKLLNQRVQNAPPERNEGQWLAGWLNRVKTYLN